MFKYHCVSCGREIKEDEMLVPLSYMALDGAFKEDMQRTPVFIAKKKLQEFVNRKDSGADCQYITMEEFLEIAYDRTNKEYLISPATSAKEAYSIYKNSYDIAMAELKGARAASAEGLSNIYGENDFDEKQALEDAWAKVEIPGFREGQVRQLCENFPDGVCSSKMTFAKGYGIEFKLNRPGTYKTNTPSFFCPHCRMEICDCAFEKKQIMIGFVGFEKAGKSCLIMSMSNFLMVTKGATLKIPNPGKEKLFTRQFNNYRAGLTLLKTDSEMEDATLYSPSVLLDDILWTFVDVPGDRIYNSSLFPHFDPSRILNNPRFQAILHCDTYVLCTRRDDIENPIMRDKTMDVFQRFLQYASEARTTDADVGKETEVRFPVILTLAQLDEAVAVKSASQADNVSYNMDQYKYKREYSVMMANGMRHIIDSLKTLCYVTPISTSAYGYHPYEFTEWQKEGKGKFDDKEMSWDNAYRTPEPRNLDTVFTWVQMINGILPALKQEEKDKKMRLSDLCLAQAHFNDDIVTAVAQLFCNPSETDTEWYNTIGGGVFNSLKRNKIKSTAKKKGMTVQEYRG